MSCNEIEKVMNKGATYMLFGIGFILLMVCVVLNIVLPLSYFKNTGDWRGLYFLVFLFIWPYGFLALFGALSLSNINDEMEGL